MDKTHKPIIVLLVILALALSFRMMLLGLNRLHMDECLYSSYAILMVTHGDLGLNGGLRVDKPPVYFYFLAASFLVNGISENAARLPNIIMSLISVFILYRIVVILYKNELYAIMSAVFLSFSVLFTVFSVSAFQDISMIMLMLFSFYFFAKQRVMASAVMYALSIGCKPMTLYIIPVYFLFYFVTCFKREKAAGDIIAMIKGASFVAVPILLWSVLLANPRWGIFSFFITQ